MSKEKIEVGDVVYLKSGGPAMTVSRLFNSTNSPSEEHASCLWIGEGNEAKTHSFPVACLTTDKAAHNGY